LLIAKCGWTQHDNRHSAISNQHSSVELL